MIQVILGLKFATFSYILVETSAKKSSKWDKNER